MGNLSRRKLLSSLGVVLGAGTVAAAAPPVAEAVAPRRSFSLYGSRMRVLGPRTRQTAGASSTVRGTLHAADGGPATGEFFAAVSVLAERSMLDADLGSFETHLFTLPDGTLTGAGTVHHDGTGAFTITGGSGRFAAARGTYASRQSADHSGTGTAEFTFTIG